MNKLLGILLLLLLGCGSGNNNNNAPPYTPPQQPTASGWNILYSSGMPAEPTIVGQEWYIDFPTDPNSHVHYIVGKNTVPLDQIVAHFTVTGGGFIPQEVPTGQALVTLITYDGDTRYFSRNSVALAAGTFTLTASEWITVDGKSVVPATPDKVGVVFGHETGRGHGVYATQPSRFTLHSIAATK